MLLKHYIELEAKYSKYIITPLCWLSLIGHPCYWAIWTYFYPQPYDSLILRCSAAAFSLAILLRKFWPKSIKKHFAIIWIVHGSYILPFLFTYIGLKNQFNFVWSICHMGMIFLLILYTAQTIIMLFSVLTGTVAGFVFHTISSQSSTLVLFPIEYAPLFFFGITTGLLLNYYSMKGVSEYESKISLERQKTHHLKSLAGSIAHEMRNPLSQIHGSLHMLERELPQLNNNEYTQIAHKVIRSGFQLIDLTMDAINEKPINKENFKIISAQNLVADVLWEYAFVDNQQKDKVSMRGGDFSFLADPVILKYVLYNLIGNALYYVKTLPNAKIVITVLANTRQIVVRDIGPGIEPEAIPKLFDGFYTSDKQGGTGLGLAYCKRTMKALGGDIRCESELGEYTAFVLSFPKSPNTSLHVDKSC